MSGDRSDLGSFTAAADDPPEERRVVCHVDMDCFYASCERLREPALRSEPLVVGMGYEADDPHGAVATASYEAREFGVESAMAISEALDRLPRKVDAASDSDLDVDEAGFYRPVDLDYYREVAAEVKSVLRDYADVVREVSIDEAYLDVTDRVRWPGESDVAEDDSDDGAVAEDDSDDGRPTVTEYARDLAETIDDEVGVAASVGVAPAMSAAKIASDYDKPNGLVVVQPGEVREFLAPLPVEEIHNVGPVTARQFREMGIETAGDLAAAEPDELRERFGERGLEVRRFARGEDPREVTPVGEPKSLSRESAFTDATDDTERKRERVRALAADVAERAEREGALYQTIGIKVVTPPYDVNTRAESLPGPIQDADLVAETALDLLEEFVDDRVRKLGVRVSNLSFAEGEQASLGGFEGASDSAASGAADSGSAASGGAGAETAASDESATGSTTADDSRTADAETDRSVDPTAVDLTDFEGAEGAEDERSGRSEHDRGAESGNEGSGSAEDERDRGAGLRPAGQTSLWEFV